MKIVAIYRTCPSENKKNRPAYYSKTLMLKSFLIAWSKLEGEKYLITVVDGHSIADDHLEIVNKYSNEIFYLNGLGNSRSYIETFKWLNKLNKDDILYYSEDDYLYHPDAFNELRTAAETLNEVDYFSLYDHPDRYTRFDDYNYGKEKIYLSGTRHWRTIESTCMTFAARASTFKRDIFVHKFFCKTGAPKDRLLWRFIRGIGVFFMKFPKRKLISPMPALCSHMEVDFLSPIIDWEKLAAETRHNFKY